MPSATLNFSAPINVSCQVGDTAYYVDTNSVGGFTVSTTNSMATQENTIVEIGEIREIQGPKTNTPAIIVETTLGYNELNGLNRFIFFSKNNKANLSSPLGYYASVKLTNNDSASAGELYSVGVDTFTSSK